jgi:hypothetical protein
LLVDRIVDAVDGPTKRNNTFRVDKPMAEPAGLCRIGFAFSGIVAIVVVFAAATVSASIGVL